MDIRQFRVVKTYHSKLICYLAYFFLSFFPTCTIAEVISVFSPGQVERQLRNTVNIQPPRA
ncbi:hypothetical protein [Rickettsiella endosymbiont of Xylota segnis]|uniref:hypothetical protein n=1 Tax=Rickettsiella endosymbiont of Xylota segnis TaxID=3066238 RepID=UPI0030D4B31D